ncbi:MAG: arginyltransferase [Pseudomonadota bacterium]
MTEHFKRAKTEFYMTPQAPCPYLAGAVERKLFAFLGGPSSAGQNDYLTRRGFRRSQNIIYMPSCPGCNACVPVRIAMDGFALSKSQRRTRNRNADLTRTIRPAQATSEQFSVLRAYLDARHYDGGMADMTALDYIAMVEETSVDTMVIEYRDRDGRLIAVGLTDRLSDGLSMVYSFFDPDDAKRSLGDYVITDHADLARELNLPYVYLGYWVAGSRKMDYKKRYKPLEKLTPAGWVPFKDD